MMAVASRAVSLDASFIIVVVMVVTADIRKVTFSSALYFFCLSLSRNSENYWDRNEMLSVFWIRITHSIITLH